MLNKIFTILIILMIAVTTSAQTHKIAAYVIGSGGATVQSTTHKAMGTVGQPAIGVFSNASNTTKVGFWYLIPSEVMQQIALLSGWNMISSFIIPSKPLMDSVFNNIVDNILIVKNNSGKLYVPSYNINTIGDWNIQHGYQVYSTSEQTLTILGIAVVPETDTIYTQTGWNMLGYLRNAPMSSPVALATLTDFGKLLIAKNGAGKIFVPSYNINTIGSLKPGDGYQMYITSPDTLIYPAN